MKQHFFILLFKIIMLQVFFRYSVSLHLRLRYSLTHLLCDATKYLYNPGLSCLVFFVQNKFTENLLAFLSVYQKSNFFPSKCVSMDVFVLVIIKMYTLHCSYSTNTGFQWGGGEILKNFHPP